MTMTTDGKARSCVYETSDGADGAQECEAGQTPAPVEATSSGPVGLLTKVTFERRFSPGAQPEIGELHVGDTLLGGQVMMLAIDAGGAVRGCRVVATAGDMPAYGCREAQAERFRASADRASEATREGFMTILVYGHSEQTV